MGGLARALAAFVLASLASETARADRPRGRTASLSWVRLEGAESCVSTQAFAHAVEERLGRKVFVSASDADISVEGHASRATDPAGWRAVLSVRDARGTLLGERQLASKEASCDALGDQLTFVASVMIDAEAPTPRATAPEVVVQRETVFVPVERPPAEKPPGWSVATSAGASAGIGMLPDPSAGVTASITVAPPRFWALTATGTYWFDQSTAAERGARAEVSLAYAGLGLCPLSIERAPVMSRACAGGQVGTLRMRGVGFDTTSAGEGLVMQAFVQGQVGLRIVGPLAAVLAVSLLVPITRNELTYRAADGSEQQLFRGSAVAASGDLGLGLFFP